MFDLEAMGIAQEEAAEFIQACSKIRRSGPFYQPFNGTESNFELAQNELYDLLTLAEKAGFDIWLPDTYRTAKLGRLNAFSCNRR